MLSRNSVAKQDPHQPLRDDVKRLGQILGSTLREQLGEAFFERVETVRSLAKKARAGGDAEFKQLLELLHGLSASEMLPLARAFSHFLTLANFAESHHRLRRRRQYEMDEQQGAQPGSSEAMIAELLAAGVTTDALVESLARLRIDLVLTAHPTETLRRSLQHKYQHIAEALMKRDRPDLTPAERDEIDETLKREITGAWMTNEIRALRPTPLEEAKSGLAIIDQVLWDAAPAFLRSLDRALMTQTGRELPLDIAPIRFDSWMGGDRDGNPNVTSLVTRQSIHLAHWMASELYFDELARLVEELSMSAASDELRAHLRKLNPAWANVSEPYRFCIRPLREKMRTTGLFHYQISHGIFHPSQVREIKVEDTFTDKSELLDVLHICSRSLVASGAASIANGRLRDVIRRLHIFDLSLVRLDIRQESTRHAKLVAAFYQASGLGDYLALDESARQNFLLRALSGEQKIVIDSSLASDEAEVWATFSELTRLPRASLGAYVISMARSASDVLSVELLQKLAAAQTGVARTYQPLRVVPLFEQVEDLRASGATLEKLFSIPWYLEHIRNERGERHQEIMIGYSDSAKSASQLAAAWALYQAQETVTSVCARFGVQATLFHGRGGSVSRGGAPTFMAIAAQPPGSIRNSMRVTEQGEIILAKFGLEGLAVRNLELYTSAVLSATLRPAAAPKVSWREKMTALAQASELAYRDVIEHTPGFIDYFRASTPEEELGLLNIGSRPARRGKTTGLSSLRAIPWTFAWTQTRLHLPAWLGIDRALQFAPGSENAAALAEMYRDWPFFRTTIDLIEMVMAKSEPTVAARYDEVLVSKSLQPIGVELRARLARVRDVILKISGHTLLLETNPVLRRSIDVRNPYVDPINFMQVELLRRSRENEMSGGNNTANDPNDVAHAVLREALLVTMSGIAAGMRNTG